MTKLYQIRAKNFYIYIAACSNGIFLTLKIIYDYVRAKQKMSISSARLRSGDVFYFIEGSRC